MGQEQPGTDHSAKIRQVSVRPRRRHIPIKARAFSIIVPGNPKTIAIDRKLCLRCVLTLLKQRMLGQNDDALEGYFRSNIGCESTH